MKIQNVTIYGGGLIGSGWATHLLHHFKNGNIIVYDLDDEKLEACKEKANQGLEFFQNEGIIDEKTRLQYMASLKTTTDVKKAVEDADLIIECVPEKLELKQSVIANIEQYCKDDAIISSSTSGIMANRIVANARRPERILGAHPYNPVYLLPLLEIIKNDRLEDQYLQTALEFFRSIDKKPVVLLKDSPQYIGSRLMAVLCREALTMLADGICTMEDLDDAFTYGPGMRYGLMGIMMTYQLGGGKGGLNQLLNGPIGQSAMTYYDQFANWTKDTCPQKVYDYMEIAQDEMNKVMANRDDVHGRTNEEIEAFRDHGLLELLKVHHLI